MASTDLLLVAREGNGKSCTGNTILNQKVFSPRSAYSQASNDVAMKSAVIDGRTVNVVDGVSIRDSSIAGPDNVSATIGLAERAISLFANGITAAIIVLKYGVRYTQQERTAINIIRSLFGDNFIRNYGVVVMTYGDSFDKDMEDEQQSFETWCQHQSGDIRDLFKECGDRCVLFNNRTNDSGQIKEQVRKLMLKVAEVQSKGARYTMDTFRKAKTGQRKLLVESKLPELQRKTISFLDDISHNLRKLDDSFYTPINCIQELEVLKQRVDKYKAHLEEEDEGTNSISQLKIQISVTEASINAKRERNERKMEFDARIPRSATPPLSDQIKALSSENKVVIFVILLLIFLGFIFWQVM